MERQSRVKVESGISVELSSSQWVRYTVTVDVSDFPPGTFDSLSPHLVWESLSIVGELFSRAEAARRSWDTSEENQGKIQECASRLKELGVLDAVLASRCL